MLYRVNFHPLSMICVFVPDKTLDAARLIPFANDLLYTASATNFLRW